MITPLAPAPPPRPPTLTARARAVLLAAGLAYSVLWIGGLFVSPADTTVRATDAEVVAQFSRASVPSAVQFVITEVLTGVCLATVTLLLGRAAGGRAGRVVAATGLSAAALSGVQGAAGVALAVWAAPGGHARAAGWLFEGLNRGDGVKMLVLAAMATAGARLGGAAGPLPRWLGPLALALAAALLASALGYLLLDPSLALAAYVSLPLLLLWVTAAAVAAARRAG